jgi:hypothetical protein
MKLDKKDNPIEEKEEKLRIIKERQFSVRFPKDLLNKLNYIKKRTFMSKQRIILMTSAINIEKWCKDLMDEELAIRTGAYSKPREMGSFPIDLSEEYKGE